MRAHVELLRILHCWCSAADPDTYFFYDRDVQSVCCSFRYANDLGHGRVYYDAGSERHCDKDGATDDVAFAQSIGDTDTNRDAS